ncbi:hypothetical protein [Sphingomonas sp. Leaf412]|uniref:hypothetical protein n=1 Tax=Sphingomonas sp. Leaf412 TaxID=1736370 RepID=UPI000A6FC0D1|nr:hypothetical protein [Sphingomonas sp. Leaf412]
MLEQEWEWTAPFATQPKILRYLRQVVDLLTAILVSRISPKLLRLALLWYSRPFG